MPLATRFPAHQLPRRLDLGGARDDLRAGRPRARKRDVVLCRRRLRPGEIGEKGARLLVHDEFAKLGLHRRSRRSSLAIMNTDASQRVPHQTNVALLHFDHFAPMGKRLAPNAPARRSLVVVPQRIALLPQAVSVVEPDEVVALVGHQRLFQKLDGFAEP